MCVRVCILLCCVWKFSSDVIRMTRLWILPQQFYHSNANNMHEILMYVKKLFGLNSGRIAHLFEFIACKRYIHSTAISFIMKFCMTLFRQCVCVCVCFVFDMQESITSRRIRVSSLMRKCLKGYTNRLDTNYDSFHIHQKKHLTFLLVLSIGFSLLNDKTNSQPPHPWIR